MAEQTSWIVNTTDDSFEADVYDRSTAGLVIVDFWAEWCAPCRMLAPLLERMVEEAAGRVTLVKADADQCPKAAMEFGVSGIPAVYAVLDRKVVDSFQGLLPEPALQSWLERLLGSAEMLEAQRLADQDPAAAEQRLRKIIEHSPSNWEAMIALAEVQLRGGHEDACRETIEQLEARGFLEPAAQRVKAALEMKGRESMDVDAARAATEANPADSQLQLTLAEALLGKQQYAEGFDVCLSLVERDRQGAGEKARELMVEAFKALPEDSELVRDYRRRLTLLLY